MTWLLVTTTPAVSMMKPQPSELVLRGGGPALAALAAAARTAAVLEEVVEELLEGRAGRQLRHGVAAPPPLASTVCEVEMLTTASITFSATSAMPVRATRQGRRAERAECTDGERGQPNSQRKAAGRGNGGSGHW